MKKIKKTLSALAMIAKNPWLLNKIIDDNSEWQKRVTLDFGMPDGFPVITLDELFDGFSVTLNSFSFSGGGSLPTDIALLKLLSQRKPETSYFEIGTWRGESVLNVAESAKECFTLNLSPEEIIRFSGSKKYADAHFFFSKDLTNVTHFYGDSKAFDFKGLDKKFDLIFIDGNHHHDYIKSDTENVFRHLMKEDSIVVWHDYAYNPESLRYETMHAILGGVPKELHRYLYFVANTMCAIFIKENFSSKTFELHADPETTFEVSMKSKRI